LLFGLGFEKVTHDQLCIALVIGAFVTLQLPQDFSCGQTRYATIEKQLGAF